MKLSGEQIDDRIVEVHWDPEVDRWRMLRFRDDKPNGNFRTVVENIIQSISDGVEKSMVGPSPRYLCLLTCWLSVACSQSSRSQRVESASWSTTAKHSEPTAARPVGAQWSRGTTSVASSATSIWTYRGFAVE